jgi:hypothetical protein
MHDSKVRCSAEIRSWRFKRCNQSFVSGEEDSRESTGDSVCLSDEIIGFLAGFQKEEQLLMLP